MLNQPNNSPQQLHLETSSLHPSPTPAPADVLPLSSVLSAGDKLDEEVPDSQDDIGDSRYDRGDDLEE
jgi:hypothetical protein